MPYEPDTLEDWQTGARIAPKMAQAITPRGKGCRAVNVVIISLEQWEEILLKLETLDKIKDEIKTMMEVKE